MSGKKIWSLIYPALIVFGIIFLIEHFFIEFTQVSGPSMSPNLTDKQMVLAFKGQQLEHGDVITFNAAKVDPNASLGTLYVKRIIGMPGDTVEARDGKIYVNNQKINENFISSSQQKNTGDWTLNSLSVKNSWRKRGNYIRVPNNEYFVLGDNRKVSKDSRYFGFVPSDAIVGKVKVPFLVVNRSSRKSEY